MVLQLENSDYVCEMKYFYEIKFLTLKQNKYASTNNPFNKPNTSRHIHF
jgi:hypothetical protein